MKRYIRYFALIAAASSLLSACDSSPTGVEFKRQDDIVIGNGTHTFTFPITGPNGEDIAFQYITPQGGRVAAGGHEMLVPAGAVSQPTWFLMSVVASDRIQVKLKAWRASDWAPVSQFPVSNPIRLNLNVSKVTGIDLSQLVVVYLPDERFDGRKEAVLSTLSADAKMLTGYVSHFSMYAVAFRREYTIGLD
jgi:hypothetical protein